MSASHQDRGFDEAMMRNALHVARRGLGNTAPNPAVGAVIADPRTGEIIARGWTQPGGRPHAETEAIRRAGARAKGATLYVTLEPCAHFGKTPPCADAIIAAGLARVVVGTGDPDPRTKGQGIARLRAHGIDVTEGVLEAEVLRVTLGHILRVTEQRPFVQLKMAFDAEGLVPRGAKGQPLFVTGPEARAHGHLLRAEADAILVGSGTVIDDNPDLTCRLPGLEDQSPVRIVVAGRRPLPLSSKVVTTARATPTWVIDAGSFVVEPRGGLRIGEHRLADANPPYMSALEAHGVRVLRPMDEGPPLRALLALLAGEGITRLLVEGGPRTWARFAEAGLQDEVVAFLSRGTHQTGDAIERARRAIVSVAPSLEGRLASLRADVRALPTDDVVTFEVPYRGTAS